MDILLMHHDASHRDKTSESRVKKHDFHRKTHFQAMKTGNERSTYQLNTITNFIVIIDGYTRMDHRWIIN